MHVQRWDRESNRGSVMHSAGEEPPRHLLHQSISLTGKVDLNVIIKMCYLHLKDMLPLASYVRME